MNKLKDIENREDIEILIARFYEKMLDDNEEILPEEVQARIFKRFVRGNFMATPKEWYNFRRIII